MIICGMHDASSQYLRFVAQRSVTGPSHTQGAESDLRRIWPGGAQGDSVKTVIHLHIGTVASTLGRFPLVSAAISEPPVAEHRRGHHICCWPCNLCESMIMSRDATLVCLVCARDV